VDYSPERRTALVLCGTGAHGAYHAGVLRAIREAGIRIDVVAGHGVGAGAAVLAAIDGGSALWDESGVWKRTIATPFYRWNASLRAAGWLTIILGAVVTLPFVLLAVGLGVYFLGFLLGMLEVSAGATLVGLYVEWSQTLFSGPNLPTIIPRAAMIVGGSILAALTVGTALSRRRDTSRRPLRRGWWWSLVGAPLDGSVGRHVFVDAVWQLIRGAADQQRPEPSVAGRRYGDALAESLGQPGVYELLIAATDLDARQDIVAALLREPFRQAFFSPRPGRERQAETIDLAGPGGDSLVEVLGGALTPGIGVDPSPVRFAADSFWRGETHRLCDRPGIIHRLLRELLWAGVEQIIVVSAVAVHGVPHRLGPANASIPGRIGDVIAAGEATAFDDAMVAAESAFAAVHGVRPVHNPLGPFDFDGTYDQPSDRWSTVGELLELGYEDAHRQFIDPVIGASGEQFASMIGDAHDEGILDDADSRR